MPIVAGGGDRWAGRRALEAVITESLMVDLLDDDVRRILGKEFDFVVTDAARRSIAERKAGVIYDAIFATIRERVEAGDSVSVSGLGTFALSESAGAGVGQVYPVGYSLGPLRTGWELKSELREALFVVGDDMAGEGAAWAFGAEKLSWSLGEFQIINVPFYYSGWMSFEGVGPSAFYKIKSQLIRVSGSLSGHVVSIGGYWAIARGRWHTVGGKYFLEIEGGDSSELKALANAHYGYDYAGSIAGAWLAGADERLGVVADKMPSAAAYGLVDSLQMSAAWALKGYPREVVMMGLAGAPVGDVSWRTVEWLNADEFNTRYLSQKAALIAAGVVWPSRPVTNNKFARIVCHFDDEAKAALNPVIDYE